LRYIGEFTSLFENLASIGTLDFNFYARPLAQTNIINTSFPSGNASRTLESWQQFSGQDANSKKTAQEITSEADFQFEYNNTQTEKKVILAQPMIDITGKKFVNEVLIAPYSSIVLMKDYKPNWITKVEQNKSRIQCFPNCFSSQTTFQFTIEQTNIITTLEIFNMSGQKVNELINQHYNPGTYSLEWNGTSSDYEILSKGIYI